MHKITDDQIEFILDDIRSKGIDIEDIQYNLLDHICCVIENEMPDREDFFKFYEYILPRFFKESLREIQDETELLLKFKDYYTMKKSLYISGLSSAILTLAGATFKALHLPGAAFMIFIGILFFSLIFLPLMIVLKFRDDESKANKIVISIGLILGIAASMGTLFKLMHWPYANLLMITSTATFIFGFAPLYFAVNIRSAEKKLNTTVNTVLMMATGGMLFALMNLGYSKNLEESYASAQFYLESTERSIKVYNANYYDQIPQEEELNKLKKATEDLHMQIEKIKTHLISNIEGIEIKPYDQVSTADFKKAKEVSKVYSLFEIEKGEMGRENLFLQMKNYNKVLQTLTVDFNNRQINLELLPMDHLTLELLLNQLTQIQLQITNTENSYLMYRLAQAAND